MYIQIYRLMYRPTPTPLGVSCEALLSENRELGELMHEA